MISNSKILIPRVSSRAIQRTQFEFGLPWPQWWLTQSSKIDFRHGKLVFIGQMTFIQSSKIRKKVQKNSWNRFLPKTIWFFSKKINFTNSFAHFSYFRALCLRRNSIAAVAENWYQLYRIDICYLWSHKNSEKKIDKFVVTVIIGKLWIISIKCRKKCKREGFFLFSTP